MLSILIISLRSLFFEAAFIISAVEKFALPRPSHLKTFQPVPAGGFGGDFNYGKDDKHVFWNDSIIQGADPGSFEKMTFPDGDSWTVFDRNRIYEGKDSPKLREYLKKKYGK